MLFICGAHHHTTLILNERVVLCFVDREVCVKPSALRGKPPTPGSQAPTMAVFIFYLCWSVWKPFKRTLFPIALSTHHVCVCVFVSSLWGRVFTRTKCGAAWSDVDKLAASFFVGSFLWVNCWHNQKYTRGDNIAKRYMTISGWAEEQARNEIKLQRQERCDSPV